MAGFRKRRTDETASFDSLLDTMTNVVGILIVVLVVTQLGVSKAMKRITSSLPPVAPEALAEVRRQAEGAAAELDARRREALAVTAPDAAALAALKKQAEELRRRLVVDPARQKELDVLRKRLAEAEKRRQDAAKKNAEASRQEQEMQAKLARTPDRSPPPSLAIPMPDPRPVPADYARVVVICRYNRVAVADMVELRELALERMRAGRVWVVAAGASPKEQGRAREDPILCDPVKLKAFFAQQNIGTRDFRLNCSVVPERRIRNIQVHLRPDGGETPEQIRQPASRFNLEVRQLAGKKSYLSFLVWPDSFEAYIEARKLCDRAGVPAGWDIPTFPHWEFWMDGRVKIKGEAPPPPPAPPGTGAPKPPPPMLD